MLRKFLATGLTLIGASFAYAQPVVTADLYNAPADGTNPAPVGFASVDINVAMGANDRWSSAGIAGSTANGALLHYNSLNQDPNDVIPDQDVTGAAPSAATVPTVRHTTSVSRAQGRDGNARWTAAAAATEAGGWSPNATTPTLTETAINLAWLDGVPPTFGTSSGFIARLTLNLLGTDSDTSIPGLQTMTDLIVVNGSTALPQFYVPLFTSLGSRPEDRGTVVGSRDFPALNGIDWVLAGRQIPEPATLVLLALGGLAAARRR